MTRRLRRTNGRAVARQNVLSVEQCICPDCFVQGEGWGRQNCS